MIFHLKAAQNLIAEHLAMEEILTWFSILMQLKTSFLINTKIWDLKKKSKTMHHTKKIPRIKTFFFHVLHLSSKFKSFRFNKKNLKLNRSF